MLLYFCEYMDLKS